MPEKGDIILRPNIPLWRSKRYQLALMYCFGYCVQGILMFNLSIAIVCMVQHDVHNTTTIYNITPTYNTTVYNASEYNEGQMSVTAPRKCAISASEDHITNTQMGEFQWDKQLQGLLLGGMFWGYTAGQILCGWLSQRYGPRLVVGITVGGAALLNILTPVSARLSAHVFLANRILSGFGLASIYPSLTLFWSKWAPPSEYSSLMSLSIAGWSIGNALAFPVGGLICGSDVSLGWPFIFYTSGGVSLLWALVWLIFVRDTPAQMTSITQIEKAYIESSLRHRVQMTNVNKIPWIKMLTSRYVIATIVTHCLGNYIVYMLFTQIPTYFFDVLQLDMKSNGLYSMLPVVFMGIALSITGFVSDKLISKRLCTVGGTRKLMNTLGAVVPGVCIVILAMAECDQLAMAVTILCIGVGFLGIGMGSYGLNYGDLALQYAGTLSGIGNTFASVTGIVAPYVVSLLTTHGTRAEWQIAFYSTGVIAGICALVFIFFGSGELQSWARPPSLEKTVEKPLTHKKTADDSHSINLSA